MDLFEKTTWPPQYIIKRHARARHVKLKTSIQHGLEIVVPLRFNQKHIFSILEKNKSWIEKQLQEHDQVRQRSNLLPSVIILHSIHETWPIEYIKTGSEKLQLITRPSREIVLLGNTADKAQCKKRLIDWLKMKAEIHLNIFLKEISELTKLSFSKVTIRDQRSRWGSCNTEKSISLNYKLLFLPNVLMKHILIHELCHTIHLNHSSHFFRLLATFDPEWKEHNVAIRKADQWVPAWLW